MRRRRATLALGALALGSLSGCGGAGDATVECIADYPYYVSADDLVAAADVVVRGTLTGSRPDRSTPGGSGAAPPAVMTVLAFEVTEALQGAVAVGEVVEVRHHACEDVGIDADEVGADHVLVLSRPGPGEPLYLVTPVQGAYRAAGDGDLTRARGNDLPVDSVDDLRTALAGGA